MDQSKNENKKIEGDKIEYSNSKRGLKNGYKFDLENTRKYLNYLNIMCIIRGHQDIYALQIQYEDDKLITDKKQIINFKEISKIQEPLELRLLNDSYIKPDTTYTFKLELNEVAVWTTSSALIKYVDIPSYLLLKHDSLSLSFVDKIPEEI